MMNRTPRRSLVCSSLALALTLVPSLPVLAATSTHTAAAAAAPRGDTSPEDLSAQAVEKFGAKQYDEAIALFEQAYALDAEPNYLFNIGRVYEEKGDLENAVVYYQRFVAQPGVDLESRQAATQRLKILRETLAELEADDEQADPPPEETPDEITPVEPPPDDEATAADEEAAVKRKKALRYTGYGLLGLGGAGLVVGGIYGGIASGTVAEAEADMYIDRRAALLERASRQARVADAMFITGGVIAAAGLTLVLVTLGGKKGGKTEQVARRSQWTPMVGPRRVGLGFSHRF